MAGMDFEFTVSVNGVGSLEELAAAAREAESALHGVRDADLELGAASAESAAGIAAQAAALDAASKSVSDLNRGGLSQLSKRISEGASAARDSGDAMRALEEDSRRMGVTTEIASRGAALGMEDFRQKIEDLRKTGREAEAGINDLQKAVTSADGGGTRRRVAEVGAFHGIKDAAKDLKDLEKVAKDAGGGGGRGGFLSSLFGAMAKGGASALSSLKGTVFTPMAGLIAGVAGLAAGAVPAVLSLGGGFAAFGALAAPALYKVKQGLSNVTWAQQQYQMARGIEARDPTKGNLENEQKALAALKTTWAQMPAPIAGAVSGIRQFEKAWSGASRKSGIQKDALGDIKLAAKDAKALIPSITGLAKAAAPVIHGMLGNLGKEFKSSGFHNWIKGLEKDMAPAAHAMKSIGGAFGGFITQLTAKEAKPGTAMLKSIGSFLKTITPGMVTGLTGMTKGITGLFNAMNKVASSKLMSQTVADFKIANKMLHGPGIGGTVKQAEAGLSDEAKKYTIRIGVEHLKGISLKGLGRLADIPIKVVPEVKGGDLASALKQTQQLKAHVATVPVKVKADGADIKKQVSDAAKSGGSIPLKGKVTLTGLKAGIQSQVAALHIPDSKVKLSIQVAGAGAAKAAVGSVVGAARKAAAGAAAALSGLGAAGSAAGAAMDAGMAAGINAGAGAVAAAAKHVAGIAAAAMAAEAEIHSPSKKTERIGKELIAGLVKGLLGGESEVQKAVSLITGKAMPFKDAKIAATIKKLRTDVRKEFREHKISATQRDDYVDFIDRGNRKLMKLAQQRAKLEAQITAATKLAASVRQGAIAFADITGITSNIAAAKNSGKPAGSITDQQKTDLGKIKEFTKDIRKLKREGLDKTSIKQLLAAGVSGGLPAAQQLLASGKTGVKETAKLEKQIIAASKKLGITGANAAYESGSQIGKGLASGLRSELKGVEQAMAQLAKHLINELRKDMGLPPLKDGGSGHGGGGGGGGGHHGRHHRMRPGPPHGWELPGGGHVIGGPPPMMHPGTSTTHITTHVVIDGRVIATSVQTHTLRRSHRNVAGGLKLSNRGV